MSYFKVKDMRLKFSAQGVTSLRVVGLVEEFDTTGHTTSQRAAAMASVFTGGRDCYWDKSASNFVTNVEGPLSAQPPALTQGRISFWDVVIPLTGQITITLAFVSDAQTQLTSGSAAIGRAVLHPSDADLGVIIAILNSKYARYQSGELRNSDIP